MGVRTERLETEGEEVKDGGISLFAVAHALCCREQVKQVEVQNQGEAAAKKDKWEVKRSFQHGTCQLLFKSICHRIVGCGRINDTAAEAIAVE